MREREAVLRVLGSRQTGFSVTMAVMVFASVALSAFAQPVPLPQRDEKNQPDQAPTQIQLPSRPLFTHTFGVKKNQIPTPDFQVAPTVKQGEVLTVRLKNPSDVTLGTNDFAYVTLAGQKARLFAQKDDSLVALLPVSVFAKPGESILSVFNAAGAAIKTLPITIQDAHYKTQNVSVSKTTAGLQPLPGELEAIQALKDMVSPVKYWDTSFISPTPDCQNSPFGVKRLHNGVPTGDYHKGVDLRSPAGRPIRAIAGGKVEIARMYRLHGGTVGLDHGQGVGSIYIHMSRLAVQPGAVVKKGQVIGYVGSTGFATGPHLHWGMYVSGLPVNPNQWLPPVPKCQ